MDQSEDPGVGDIGDRGVDLHNDVLDRGDHLLGCADDERIALLIGNRDHPRGRLLRFALRRRRWPSARLSSEPAEAAKPAPSPSASATRSGGSLTAGTAE